MIILIITLFTICFFIYEYYQIKQIVHSIPMRIHINGTRGKSTTTELIYTICRSSNFKTIGKITGVIPTILLPNGGKKIIKRYGEARLIEQLKIIKLAKKLSANILALECMSVTPEYQKVETHIFKPDIYVITNIKYDHAEQMGVDINQMIEAICTSIPSNCSVVTGETRYLEKIKEFATLKKSSVVSVPYENIPKNIYYLYGIHPNNLAIALKVCELIGIDQQSSINSLMKELNKNNSLISNIKINDKNIYFVNGFSINDVSSADEFIRTWKEYTGIYDNMTLILNTRSDRPLRTLQFVNWILSLDSIDNLIISGTHKYYARHQLIKSNFDRYKITLLNKKILNNYNEFKKLFIRNNQLVFGLANIKGDGFKIIEIFQKIKTGQYDN